MPSLTFRFCAMWKEKHPSPESPAGGRSSAGRNLVSQGAHTSLCDGEATKNLEEPGFSGIDYAF